MKRNYYILDNDVQSGAKGSLPFIMGGQAFIFAGEERQVGVMFLYRHIGRE